MIDQVSFYDASLVLILSSEVSFEFSEFNSEFLFNNINKREPIFSLIFFLSIIESTKPHSWTYSAVWKFSGSSSLIVAWITFFPAKAIKLCFSANAISLKLANEAVIPPAVGSVKQTIYGRLFFF